MKCIIREKESAVQHSVGEPKELIVDAIDWEKDGRQGKQYSYHMSKERFERKNKKSYEVWISKEEAQTPQEIKLMTLGYYDFVDFGFAECLRERVLENAAKQLNSTTEEIRQTILSPLEKLQKEICQEYGQTEESVAAQEHEAIIKKHEKARRDFSMQFGFPPQAYDRCYNVFGQLMDAEYLGYLHKILEERERMGKQSKRYRKAESQKRFHEYLHSSNSVDYTEEEQIMLSKFYKLLAKKYHPDSNPGVDTSEEMTLLNKVKRQWNV